MAVMPIWSPTGQLGTVPNGMRSDIPRRLPSTEILGGAFVATHSSALSPTVPRFLSDLSSRRARCAPARVATGSDP